MPSQITPVVNTITGTVATENKELEYMLEQLEEAGERINKQLGIITGLELEKGDI
jgi:hypothetical protein